MPTKNFSPLERVGFVALLSRMGQPSSNKAMVKCSEMLKLVLPLQHTLIVVEVRGRLSASVFVPKHAVDPKPYTSQKTVILTPSIMAM